MNFKSIKSKIAFSAGAGLLITAAILVGYSISSTTVNNRFINKTVSSLVERITLDKMQSVAAEYAQSISPTGKGHANRPNPGRCGSGHPC